jgi:hypothetical protein
MERLDFDLLFRWFVGLGVDDPLWDHSTFSKNRDRLLDSDVAAVFLSTKRSNDTHASTTDPDARLYRRGPGQVSTPPEI